MGDYGWVQRIEMTMWGVCYACNWKLANFSQFFPGSLISYSLWGKGKNGSQPKNNSQTKI